MRYDAWYRTPRGRWIGDAEFSLLAEMLRPRTGETLLDVGCGTGYFTRRFAREADTLATGLDPNLSWVGFAQAHAVAGQVCTAGRAEALPFPDRHFDLTLSVTALCFIDDQRQALREMLRVTRSRFVLGLLNRHSLLYLKKGRHGGVGDYHGAQWHTTREIRFLLDGMPVHAVKLRSAIFLPGGGWIARKLEAHLSNKCLLGGFLVASGYVTE